MADFTSRFNELLARRIGNDSELGAELGVSKQTISAWRNGIRSPKKPHIVAIARYFNVGIPWLMGISDSESESGYDVIRSNFGSDTPLSNKLHALGAALTPSESELLSIFRRLNDTGQLALIATARGLDGNPDMKKDGASQDTTTA